MREFLLFLFILAVPLDANYNWTSLTQISNPSAQSVAPSVALDPQGNAVAVWELTSSAIQAATKLYGQPWSSFQDISNPGDVIGIPPLVQVDSQGNAVSVWAVSIISDNTLYSATKLFGQSWSVPSAIPIAGDIQAFDLALDSAGNATVVAETIITGNSHIYASDKTLMGAWSASTLLSGASITVFDPVIGVDGSGNVVSTWSDNLAIMSANKLFAGAWSAAQSIIPITSDSIPQISVNSAGNALVVAANQGVGVVTAYKPFNLPWQASQIITGSSTSSLSGPNCGLDNQGNAIVCWSTGSTLDFSTKLAGQLSWSLPLIFGSTLVGPLPSAAVNTNSCGVVLVAWDSLSGLQLSSGTIGGAFSAPFVIGNGGLPSIDQNPCGHAMVLLEGLLGNPTDIEASEGSVLQGISTLSGAQLKQDSGTEKQYINRLKWSIDSTEEISGFIIYRNGSFLNKVGPSKRSYDDVQQKKGVQVQYSVATFNSQGAETSPLIVVVP